MYQEERAETHLNRIVALIGARRVGDCCVLDIGETRFHVHGK